MSRSLRRGAIAALALAAIVPLSACAAGSTPATLQVTPDNASVSLGDNLKLNNIVVVTAADASSDTAGPANVTVNISNTGSAPETLKSVTVGDTAATFADDKGAAVSEIVIPAGGAVLLGGEGQPTAKVGSVKVSIGGFARTTFVFGTAGSVGTDAAVQPARGLYAPFGPNPTTTPQPSGSASASASATASLSPTATVSGSVSPSGAAAAPVPPSGSASAH